ncbi:MAG: transketolase C-terminal domain-containing protein [Nitrospirota bacterium]|nr:transketolase C-terminal domain-containing protein [Nitrospirota bacterium]
MKPETKFLRDVIIEQIYYNMKKDRNILFLSADFGAPALDKLRKEIKDNFINVGIAEQNLINVSTGLALEGFTVYAYAIAPFLTMRAYEQIRNNLSLLSQIKGMDINVNLIGVGAGLSYDVAGPTHHSIEDISIIRTLPNISIFSPSDWLLARKFLNYSITIKKPKYLRLDGKPLPRIYEDNDIKNVELENGFYELLKGKKICLVATGYMTHKAVSAAKKLLQNDINIGVIDVFLMRPFNENLFFKLLSKYESVISLEEAFINKGGLDSLVSSILTKKNSSIRLERMGFKDTYTFDFGSREYLHMLNKIDEESIIKNIRKLLKKKWPIKK